MKKIRVLPLVILILGLFFSACDKDQENGTVALNFDHIVAGESLVLDDIRYSAEAGHLYSVVRLKYYISNIVLHHSDGSSFEIDEVHYREAGQNATRSIILEEVPFGNYTSLSFTFGLDENTNVDGGLENTLTNINMEWPIPGDQGYHYMKFEGKYDSLASGQIKSFNLHTGATGGNQNYININMPLDFSINGSSWNIQVEMDLNEWLQNPITYDFEEFGAMIMANQDAQETLKSNGTTVFRIASVEKE